MRNWIRSVAVYNWGISNITINYTQNSAYMTHVHVVFKLSLIIVSIPVIRRHKIISFYTIHNVLRIYCKSRVFIKRIAGWNAYTPARVYGNCPFTIVYLIRILLHNIRAVSGIIIFAISLFWYPNTHECTIQGASRKSDETFCIENKHYK